MFYLGKSKDSSLGDRMSDSSEKQSRGEGQCIRDFVEGVVHAIKHIFFAEVSAMPLKVTATYEEQMSP